MPRFAPPAPPGHVIALLGAESTGKTTLAHQLHEALAGEGRRTAVVHEYLREFCDARGRTPRPDEQRAIADEQTHRIAQAAAEHEVVIADTTALTIAVYSEYLFDDRALIEPAQQAQSGCALTLLTALDIPWQPDAHQRDGPHVREPVDRLLRAALAGADLPYSVVCGTGALRLANALAAVRAVLRRDGGRAGAGAGVGAAGDPESASRWRWVCERCGDAQCERHVLPKA
jgi:nicotinamide riboside kinase